MKLKVVTGATINEAAKNVIKGMDITDVSVQHFIVVPDRFSLLTEKNVFKYLGITSTFNIQVVGLTRLARKILNEFGVSGKTLNQSESLLLTQNAIENVKDRLLALKKNNINFVGEVQKAISQFKSCKLSPKDLMVKSGTSSQKNKYHDLSIIYEEYEILIAGRLDENKQLALFENLILQSSIMQDTVVYFIGFDSWTASSQEVIATIAKVALETVVGIPTAASIKNAYIYEDDLLKKLTLLCKEHGLLIEVVDEKPELPQTQNAIIENMFSPTVDKLPPSKFLASINCTGIIDEVETVGKIINYKLRKGARYKDFSIACGDLETYKPFFDSAFAELDIPFYDDTSISAEKTYLCNNLITFLSLIGGGYRHCDILNFLSSSLFNEDQALIKRINAYNVNGKAKFYKYIFSQLKAKPMLEKLEKCENVNDYCEVISDFLNIYEASYNDFLITLENYPKEKNINMQSAQILRDIIDVLVACQGQYKEDINNFLKKLKLLLSFKQVSSVPALIDGVMIGDVTSSFYDSTPHVFVLSGASGLPKTISDNGLISDKEVENIGLSGKLEPSIRMINRRNRFKLFNLLTLANENLTTTFLSTDIEGKKKEKPSFIENLEKIFDTSEIRSFALTNGDAEQNINKFLMGLGSRSYALKTFVKSRKENQNGMFLPSLKSVLEIDLNSLILKRDHVDFDIDKLYFAKGYTKVTELETYFSCPFKHFVRYGLKVDKTSDSEFDARDLGNICHEILEIFVNKKFDYQSLSSDQIREFIKNNLDLVIKRLKLNEKIENADEGDSLIAYIFAQLLMVTSRVAYELKNTSFTPLWTEKELEGLTLHIGDSNESIKVKGKVDRVDVYGDYFRIIDYKTGLVAPIIKDLFYGDKLQLFIYQSGIRNMLKKASAGVFYFDCKWNYVKPKEDVTLLKGLVIKDEPVISAFDKRLGAQESSDILSVSLRKNPKEFIYKGSALIKSDLSSLEEYAKRVASRALGEIFEGYAEPKPDDNSCERCPYQSICLFDDKNLKRDKDSASEEGIENLIKGARDEQN